MQFNQKNVTSNFAALTLTLRLNGLKHRVVSPRVQIKREKRPMWCHKGGRSPSIIQLQCHDVVRLLQYQSTKADYPKKIIFFCLKKSESRPITLHSYCIHCTDKAFISISILPKDTCPTFFQQCCFYQDSHLISYCCLSSMFHESYRFT